MDNTPVTVPPASDPETPTYTHQAPARWSFRAWHAAGMLLLVVIGGLLLYAFWPVLTGQAAEETTRPDVETAGSVAQVEAVVVTPGDFSLRAEATGHLAPWRRAEISAEIGGLVRTRPVEEGNRVAKGALLFQLDARDQQIEVQEAEAELLKTQADYAVATRMSDTLAAGDTTRLALARSALQQAEKAHEQGILSQAELQAARRRFDTARVLSGAQRGDVQAVMSGLAQAEHRLARARLALSRMAITAPFAGRVVDIEVEEGQRISAGQNLLMLFDDSRMKVEVDVLEADIVGLRQGATARVRVPALDNEVFTGTIFAINPSIDPATGTGRVTVAIPNTGGRLIAGLFAYVSLETRRLADRLVVPDDAVLVRQGRDLVFRLADGRAEWVYVTVGARAGDEVEIVEGLSPGDTVAVGDHFALAHDAPVAITLRDEQ